MITVRFACGHPALQLGDDIKATPVCPECGELRVSRTTAPAPKFRGVCSGPSASFKAFEGVHIASAAPEGPLPLPKPPKDAA